MINGFKYIAIPNKRLRNTKTKNIYHTLLWIYAKSVKTVSD